MNNRLLAILELGTAIGLILFWAAFFTIGLAPENPPPGYFVYEHSFPLPDGVLAIGLLIGGIATWKQKSSGRIISLVCAGALIFLGLVDFSFNIQNGMYLLSIVDLILNVFINAWSIGLGILIIRFYSR